MMRSSVILKLIAVLLCLFPLAGCDRSAKERDQALAEVQRLRAELTKAKTALEEIQDEADKLRVNLTITSEDLADAQAERDGFRESLAVITEDLEKTKASLAAAMQAKDDLEYQITELIKQKTAAIAGGQEDQSIIESLSMQLKEKDGTISELEQWNTELQAAIKELENYVEQTGGQPEETGREYVKQYEEEVYDQNDI